MFADRTSSRDAFVRCLRPPSFERAGALSITACTCADVSAHVFSQGELKQDRMQETSITRPPCFVPEICICMIELSRIRSYLQTLHN